MQFINPTTLRGFFIWAISALFFTYEFFIRTATGTFEEALRHDLQIELVDFALLSTSVYVVIYGIMQIPAGLLIDKFGLKKNLSIACLISTIGVFGFAVSNNFTLSILFRGCMALGAAFSFIGLLVVVYQWFPQKNRAFLIGLSQFIGAIGPMVAAGPLFNFAITHQLNWHKTFIKLSFIGLVITALIFLILQDKKNKLLTVDRMKSLKISGKSFFSFLMDWKIWSIALYSALVYFVIEYLSENSGKVFLTLKGFSEQEASYLITYSWLGFAIGAPLLGFLSDYFANRRIIMIAASLLAVIAMLIINYQAMNISLFTFAFFILGVGASGQSISYTLMSEYSTRRTVAAALGFNNAMISFFEAINAPLVGGLVMVHAKHSSPSMVDYQYAFSFILALMLSSTVLAVFCITEPPSLKESLKS